jgi:hypothetical protein
MTGCLPTDSGCHCPLKGPSVFQSKVESDRVYADSLCPLCQGQPLAAELNESARPPVVVLFLLRCPAAVARFVIAVIVDAVKGVLRGRARTHVGQEVFKGRPPLTDFDTPASVVVEEFTGRFFAPPSDVLPATVLWGPSRPGRVPVPFAITAFSARGRSAVPKFIPRGGGEVAAGTAAKPPGAAPAGRVGENGQLPVHLPRFVFDAGRNDVRNVGSHGVNLSLRFAKWSGPSGVRNTSGGPLHFTPATAFERRPVRGCP